MENHSGSLARPTRRRFQAPLLVQWFIASCTCAVGLVSPAVASDAETAIHLPEVVLHARTPSGTGTCIESDLPTCYDSLPITQVAPGASFRLYVFVRNYDFFSPDICGLHTAFAWPADWIVDVTLPCRENQATFPEPSNPGGPTNGTYTTAFECFQGLGLVAIGRIDFLAGQSGCLTQVNPASGAQRVEIMGSLGSYYIDAAAPDGQRYLGSICVGDPGNPTCDMDGHPVDPRTWGVIKATYR